MVASWSTLRQDRKSLSAEATTVSASVATRSSVYSMPISSQSAASSSLIGRDALEMSVSPAQKTLKPPPVPDVPTETLTPGSCILKSSPAAAVSGWTVDDPSTTTSPDTPVASPVGDSAPPPVASGAAASFPPPQAVRARTRAAAGAAAKTMLRFT